MTASNGNTGSIPSPSDDEARRHRMAKNRHREAMDTERLRQARLKTVRDGAMTASYSVSHLRKVVVGVIAIIALLGTLSIANAVVPAVVSPPSTTMETGELGDFAKGLQDGQQQADQVRLGAAVGEAAAGLGTATQ